MCNSFNKSYSCILSEKERKKIIINIYPSKSPNWSNNPSCLLFYIDYYHYFLRIFHLCLYNKEALILDKNIITIVYELSLIQLFLKNHTKPNNSYNSCSLV